MPIIEIKHRTTDSVLFSGEYGSLKLCVEAAVKIRAYLEGADLGGAYLEGAYLRGADLRGADLGGAYLGGADLGGACLEGADLGGADLRGADLGGACLEGADLGGAYLGGADLRGAYLGGAYLGGAYLGGADLRCAKEYARSHDFFAQLVINSTIKFTVREQEMAARIFMLRLCWGSIRKEYGKKMTPVFKKLAKLGWGEFLETWEKENGK